MNLDVILINSLWAGFYAAAMTVIFSAPTRAIGLGFVSGFAARFSRDFLLGMGIGTNFSILMAATLAACLSIVLTRRRVIAPVVVVSSLIPLGATIIILRGIVGLLKMSSLKGDALAQSSILVTSNFAISFDTTVFIAIGFWLGLLLTGLLQFRGKKKLNQTRKESFMKKYTGGLVIVLIFTCFLTAGWADEYAGSTENERWRSSLELYGWLPQTSGSVTVNGIEKKSKFDLTDYGKIIDELQLFLPGRLTVGKGRFTLFYDGMYIKLKDNINGPLASTEVKFRHGIQELGAAFEVADWALGEEGKKNLGLEVLGGARHIYLRAEGSADVPLLGISLEADRTRQWVDPFVGGRMTLSLTEKTNISLRADVGGFGVSSDFIWNGLIEAKHYFNKDWFASVGYRGMNTDYEKGSFAYEVNYYGPTVSAGFEF